MNKKRTISLAILATLALAAFVSAPSAVSAMASTAGENTSQSTVNFQPTGPNNPDDPNRPERSNPIADALGMTEEEFHAALESGQTVEELADAAGIDLAEVILDDISAKLAQAVEDGRLTQDEADQRLAEIQERIDNGELPVGPSEHGRSGEQGDSNRPERSNPIADALGMTEEEFHAALEGGQTVEELADTAGIDLAEVILNDVSGKLAQAVEDGRLTQDEADQRLAEIQERIENGELPVGPGRQHGGQDHPDGQNRPEGPGGPGEPGSSQNAPGGPEAQGAL